MHSRKRYLGVFAVLTLALFVVGVKAQSTGEQHSFTLSWQANTNLNTTYSVNSLLTLDGQQASSSVCGQSPEGYNVWCGQVTHYGNPPAFNFNFPDLLLSSCTEGTPQSSIVYTSAS